MANQLPRTEMPEQDATKRTSNFLEVALGFNQALAYQEALRCIDCKNPRCVKACPVSVNIPQFIRNITEHNLDKAFKTIYEDNILPSICGRVCPQESQCEGSCILGIKGESVSIGALERFVGDYGMQQALADLSVAPPKHKKVAVVGSGPAGLANAASLRKKGYDVSVFEALHEFGGVLQYGIPDFRLPKDIVKKEIENLKSMGVEFIKNAVIGKSLTIDQLFEDGYDAIFIGSGAGLPSSLRIKGENLNGVYFANEFLTRVNLMKSRRIDSDKTPVKIGDKVAVVGGGNVAMDAARTAKRIGAKEVFILYRRDEASLPARKEEVHHAKEEGIEFRLLRNPVELIGDENNVINQVRCEVMELGKEDASGRRRPVGTGEIVTFDLDSIIISIGQKPNPILKDNTLGLNTHDWGGIITDSNYMTSIPGVFAGGDVVSGAATVILAMGAGKDAADAMDQYMEKQNA